jgi:hypothetical protein
LKDFASLLFFFLPLCAKILVGSQGILVGKRRCCRISLIMCYFVSFCIVFHVLHSTIFGFGAAFPS